MTIDGPLVGVVLAGGRGSRMGGPLPKPLVMLAGRSLITHVTVRLRPQVDEILISLAPDLPFPALGYATVADEGHGFGGPASGIASVAGRLSRRFGDRPFRLLTVAADTPFLPLDLASRLVGALPVGGVCVASHDGTWAPTFAIWTSAAADRLAPATNRSLRSLITVGPHAVADFARTPDAPNGDPFFNINTPGDLEHAERHLGGS